MPKVRRNDPCPCGSGKKYKNCCLRQDRITESRELNMGQLETGLVNALYEYAQSRRFAADLVDALDFYWAGAYEWEDAPAPSTEDLRRTFEWFIHDYRTSQDRRYIIDLFAETYGDNLPPDGREMLQAWAESRMGVFRLIDTSGDRLELFDPLRQEQLEAQSAVLSRNARPGDLLVGRLYELRGVKRFSLMTMILPEEYEPGLVEYVTNAYEIYKDEHYQATWDDFLRENGHIFNAFLLSSKAEPLRTHIGPGTRYHDPAVLRDQLRAHTLERRREIEREQMEEEGRRPSEHRTATGIVLPGAAEEEEPEEEPEEETDGGSRILIPGRDF